MAGIPAVAKDFRVYLDSFDTGANVSEIVLPKITQKLEEIRMGNFSIPVQMGLEALETELTMYQHDLSTFVQWGLLNNTTGQLIVFRSYQENTQGRLDSMVITMRGIFKEIALGTAKRGDIGTHKLSARLSQFSFALNGTPIIVIEPLTNTYIIGGVDQLAIANKALGI